MKPTAAGSTRNQLRVRGEVRGVWCGVCGAGCGAGYVQGVWCTVGERRAQWRRPAGTAEGLQSGCRAAAEDSRPPEAELQLEEVGEEAMPEDREHAEEEDRAQQ